MSTVSNVGASSKTYSLVVNSYDSAARGESFKRRRRIFAKSLVYHDRQRILDKSKRFFNSGIRP